MITPNDENKLMEKQTDSKEIFDGIVLHVFNDTVSLPDGQTAPRELIRHVGAVCIVPLWPDGTVTVERQYRYPVGKVLWEIPAGKLNDKFEDRLEAAKRELKEETGLSAGRWTDLGFFYPAPAYSDETITLWLAEELTQGQQSLDEDEFLDISRLPLQDLLKAVLDGDIPDAKTQMGLLKAARYKGIV